MRFKSTDFFRQECFKQCKFSRCAYSFETPRLQRHDAESLCEVSKNLLRKSQFFDIFIALPENHVKYETNALLRGHAEAVFNFYGICFLALPEGYTTVTSNHYYNRNPINSSS